MPSTRKAPVANTRKKVTASARARINTGKAKRTTNNNGSYIQETAKKTVSNVVNFPLTDPISGPATTDPANDAILAYLKKIDDTTKALGQRVQQIERNQSIDVTPLRPRSHSHDADQPNEFMLLCVSTGRQNRHVLRFQDPTSPNAHARQEQQQHSNDGPTSQQVSASQGAMDVTQPPLAQDLQRDSIIPNVDVLRRNPMVSQAVSNVLASYDTQLQNQFLQGKQATSRRSGRYNTTDTTIMPPGFRWPNEGYHGAKGKKRAVYDDLTLPQWAVGQLSNIHQIWDPTLLRQALLQVILALRDATSLPWQAVRDAWVTLCTTWRKVVLHRLTAPSGL